MITSDHRVADLVRRVEQIDALILASEMPSSAEEYRITVARILELEQDLSAQQASFVTDGDQQLFMPIVAGGAHIETAVGKKSDEFGASDACLAVTWANGALTGGGPLIALEVRLFGSFLTANATKVERIVLDQASLDNERLFFFVKSAFGSERVELNDCACHLQPGIRGDFLDGHEVHRSIECVCASDVWGFSAPTSLFLIEASNRKSLTLEQSSAAVQVHLAVLKVATGYTRVWRPFTAGGLPLFGGTPADSWVHSLAFGKPDAMSRFDLNVRVSSASFRYSNCTICALLPIRDHHIIDGQDAVVFHQGIGFKGSFAHMVARPNGKYYMLGLERIFSEIHAGSQLFTVEARLDTLDCLWHGTQKIKWNLWFDGTIPFYPAGSLEVVDTVQMQLTGIRDHEDLNLDMLLTAYLEENHAFNLSSTFTLLRSEATKDSAAIRAVANSSEWKTAFNLQWLLFDNVDILIQSVQMKHQFGISIKHFTFNGTGRATFINDPWTLNGEQDQVMIDYKGTSGRQFPHISSEITAYLTTPDPGSVVRTLTQQALHLNYSNPTCGTTACQDLLFAQQNIRMIISTWDSQEVGFAVPSKDSRSYSCVTTNGNVASGTPCNFPFEYNGQIFSECTSQDWHTLWCSTTPVYTGEWGECSCDNLRRGVKLHGEVSINENGPLVTLNAQGVHEVLAPISDGNGLGGVNATLILYFPIFDSDASTDLEMLITLVPKLASRCLGGNTSKALPTVGTAPSGECERLGYITEWYGEPGDESKVVCKHPDQVFPSGVGVDFVAAATLAMHSGDEPVESYISASSPVKEAQACLDVGLAREISLCSAEKFRNIPVAAPELFGFQFCFWTDTSRTPGLDENKFAQCAVCYGPSCTANYEPLRAWQLEDRV